MVRVSLNSLVLIGGTIIVLPQDKVTSKYFTMNTGDDFLMDKDVVFF